MWSVIQHLLSSTMVRKQRPSTSCSMATYNLLMRISCIVMLLRIEQSWKKKRAKYKQILTVNLPWCSTSVILHSTCNHFVQLEKNTAVVSEGQLYNSITAQKACRKRRWCLY